MEKLELESMEQDIIDNYPLIFLDFFYHKMKKNSKKYYINGQMSEDYIQLKRKLLKLEHNLALNYICDTKIDYKDVKHINLGDIRIIYKYDPEDILDFIVNYTRQGLISKMDVKENFDKLDVTNGCNLSSTHVSFICSNLSIDCERLKIEPGYDASAKLYNGSGYHYFNIVTILDKKYLVDCTYKQFFKTDRSSLERLGIPLIYTVYPGTFMLLDDERKKVAETILKQGWIEATDENLKHYFDGFTISFRNGLYYEALGKISYDTDYTAKDYMQFLKTSDSQIKHENIELLGFQNKPLGDYRLNFKIK